jgi:hypothetical protein
MGQFPTAMSYGTVKALLTALRPEAKVSGSVTMAGWLRDRDSAA